jgi:DNA polymerase
MNAWQGAVLREMGLAPLWRLRTNNTAVEIIPVTALSSIPAHTPASRPVVPSSPPPSPPPRVHIPRPAAAQPAAPPAPAAVPPPAPVYVADAERATRIATLDWVQLEEEIRHCRACPLCERRKQAVPGVGDHAAHWMFVGEGPGAEEDQRGEPFVGQAGRLLDNMLAAIGLKRGENVYIANAVKCRPPHNRTPNEAEIAACHPFLERQIALVAPRLLVALGRPASQALVGRELSIAAARGKRFARKEIAVVVTYHPAYLLRNPQDKSKVWEDLCFARRLMTTEAGQGA